MRWSEFQEAGLLETFWREGAVSCPDAGCGAALKASLSPTASGPFDELNLECLGCKQFVRFTAVNDRKRLEYRDWTQSECEMMLRLALNEQSVYCPVDGTLCVVTYNTPVRGTAVPTPGTAVACMRCGREFIQPS